MDRTYYEHNAGQPEFAVIDGDPADEPAIERVVMETGRYQRVITGTGNAAERRELDALIRALKVLP